MMFQKRTVLLFAAAATISAHRVHADSSAKLRGSRATDVVAGNARILSASGTSSSYSLIDQKMTYPEARAYCRAFGSDLASIASEEDNTAVAQLCADAANGILCWIGLSDEGTEGSPQWLDGTEYDYQNWSDERDNQAEKDGVIISGTQQSWIDYGVWRYNSHNTIQRVFVCGGDVPDVEVPPAVRPYSLVDQKKTFSEARAYCQAFGLDLASITSEEENDAVAQRCEDATNGIMCWIGLSDAASEGSLEWLDGTRSVYENWNTVGNSGANQTESRNAVTISGTQQSWMDWGAWEYARDVDNLERVFICEGNLTLIPVRLVANHLHPSP